MVTAETRLRINDDEIAAEVIDSEAVLINLATGTYYTMEGTGGDVWSLVERGLSLAEMSRLLAERYGVAADVVAADLQHLAAELLEEGLVRLAGEAPKGGALVPLEGEPAGAYVRPTLTRYTDMTEILALDPPLPVLKDDA